MERAYVMPPRSFLGVADDNLRQHLMAISSLYEKYEKPIDRESAYEVLQQRAQDDAEAAEAEESMQEEIRRNAGQGRSNTPNRRSSGRQQKSAVEKVVDSALSTFGRTIATGIARGILGSILGKRR